MRRSGNPTLNPEMFSQQRTYGLNDVMTVNGTVNKCFILLFLLLASAAWVWSKVQTPSMPAFGGAAPAVSPVAPVMPYVIGGGIVGFILAMVTVFNRSAARFTAPLYALCEGLVLGGLSAIFNLSYPGIVTQAVGLTFGVMFCMLAIYKSGVIKVTNNFIVGITAATGAIALFYFVSIILSFFHVSVPILYSSSPISIGFSLLVVGIAAFNLILDFHVIEEGARLGADKNMEWYGAFGLMVTLIWLYMEILRLLVKLNNRR